MTLVIEILNFGDTSLEPGLDSSLVFLLLSNPTNRLRLRQFLESKTTEANKSLKTDKWDYNEQKE